MPNQGKTEAKSHHPHDKGYRQLLANKKTFLELPQTFVREGWVREIEEGNLAYEDKIVQLAVSKILTAIYEQDFLDSSYGFRPGRSCHGALRKLNTDFRAGLTVTEYNNFPSRDYLNCRVS